MGIRAVRGDGESDGGRRVWLFDAGDGVALSAHYFDTIEEANAFATWAWAAADRPLQTLSRDALAALRAGWDASQQARAELEKRS